MKLLDARAVLGRGPLAVQHVLPVRRQDHDTDRALVGQARGHVLREAQLTKLPEVLGGARAVARIAHLDKIVDGDGAERADVAQRLLLRHVQRVALHTTDEFRAPASGRARDDVMIPGRALHGPRLARPRRVFRRPWLAGRLSSPRGRGRRSGVRDS